MARVTITVEDVTTASGEPGVETRFDAGFRPGQDRENTLAVLLARATYSALNSAMGADVVVTDDLADLPTTGERDHG